MNTNNVAGLLGVSKSTIQRWVKQLDLEMNRNELGHFHFNEEDISVLKHIQEQIHNGILLHDIVVAHKKVRKGKTLLTKKAPSQETFLEKVNDLDRRLNEKADRVVSYQLLTHRRELEELENEVNQLNRRVELLEKTLLDMNQNMVAEKRSIPNQIKQKKKVKSIITMLFGF